MIKKEKNQIKIHLEFIIGSLFFFLLIFARMAQISLSTKVDGVDLKKFASSRVTEKTTLKASRGTIYDCNGNVLAQNVSSYKIIAYLDESRSKDSKTPKHVVDKEKTAEVLAPILGMEEKEILNLLNKDAYQTEFGSKGKGLSELVKKQIEDKKLSGIDFIENQKRYYPNGDFLSYTLGYAKTDEHGNIIGELGLEKLYNEELSGKDGFIEYQKDAKGYRIADTKEVRVDAQDGEDIYLTVDETVQLFVDQAMHDAEKKYHFGWFTIMVADAKTGAILASSSSPSFDPNKRDITNYLDYNTQMPYEPGSTMKIFSYMAALENGTYDGEKTYLSGNYKTKDGTIISDWNKKGWGNITYDTGFMYSSNVAVINLIKNGLDGTYLKGYYKKLGFSSKTGIELPGEASGKVNFKYETEILNAGFGQGITTTPIQNIKALTALTNDGMLLKPYIINKIINKKTDEISYTGKRTELEQVASLQTVNKIKDLMSSVISGGNIATGHLYKMNGYDLIGKTGTAQVADTKNGGYLEGKSNVISSFAGIYPKNNSKVIVYASIYKPEGGLSAPIINTIKSIIKNTSKYYGIDEVTDENKEDIKTIELESFINQRVDKISEYLKNNSINSVIIGDGSKIIDQYPKTGSEVNSKNRIFLLTNGTNIVMPDFSTWSKKDVQTFASLVGISVKFTGSGYVTSQNVKKGDKINGETEIEVILSEKYNME